jgi:hypothetical protein
MELQMAEYLNDEIPKEGVVTCDEDNCSPAEIMVIPCT